MASSDLLLQSLMAGQQQPGVDPSVAAAMPRMQLAQALMQEGTSTAPVSGGALGGLARLAQALTGNYVFDKATEGMQGAYKNLGPQLAATLPANHPLIPALTSPDPMVRQHAVTAYDKMMPMLGGVDQARPGTTPMIGVNPAGPPTGGAVSPEGLRAADIRNNPSIPATLGTAQGVQAATAAPGEAANAGAVANAKVPAAIATAGGSKAAELPSVVAAQNNQGNVDVAVHSNAPQTLSPGQTTNINPNRVPMPGGPAPVAPSSPVVMPRAGAPDQAAAADAILRGGLTAEAALPTGGAPPRPATAPVSPVTAAPLPQPSAPAPSAAIPPSVTPAPASGAPGGQTISSSYVPEAKSKIWQSMAAADAAEVQKDQEKAAAGNSTLGTTATIRATLPSVTTGKGADYRLALSQWAASLGFSPEKAAEFTGTNPVDGELLQKKMFELSTGAVRGMGAREPGSVVSMFQKNYPNMNSQNTTIDAMTRMLDMDQMRNADYAAAKRTAYGASVNGINETDGYKGLDGFDDKFNNTNNPRVYQAAALAAGKLPYATWSNGLSPEDQTAALKLAARTWHDAGAYGPGQNGGAEVWHTMGGH